MEENKSFLLGVLQPLYASAADGEAKMAAYIATDAGYAGARDLVAAAGLITVGADGTISAAGGGAAAEGGDAEGAGARCQDPLVVIPNTVSGSLKSALQKQIDAATAANAPQELKEGMKCIRNNCGIVYEGEESLSKTCTHCPGEPVFHEGYKYWSCCEGKKTLDFDSFLSMTGCADEQKCQWFKDAAEEGETPGDVVVEIFAKCAEPEKTTVSINADTLDISTVYEKTNKFSLKVDLAGKIDITIAKVTLFSTKINIKLKKSEGGKWGALAAGDTPAE
eukprot:gene7839-168_t